MSGGIHGVPAVSLNTRIGWIGTGVMGLSMCGHVLEKGYATSVFNRSKSKALPLIEKGAVWADSPREAAQKSDVVFTMVGFPEDVREVYFGQGGILEGVRPGAILVDMTTTDPALSVEIYRAAKERGCFSVDAPVSGGDVGARNAALSIMTGGDREVVDAVRPLLEIMGKNIVHQGPAGAGQHTKMCNQIVIAGTMIGVCESLIYGFKAGLDLPTMLSSIQGGAAKCWSLDNLAPRVFRQGFRPRLFRRALHQGHGYRPQGIGAHGPFPSRTRAGAPVVPCREGKGTWQGRHAGALTRARTDGQYRSPGKKRINQPPV